MILKELDKEQIKHIYNTYMVLDFPACELKPLERILTMYDEKCYIAYGIYDKNILVSYAFLVLGNLENKFSLLDYFAVVKEYRENGYGSKALDLITSNALLGTIILETENPDYALDNKDLKTRLRRIAFYKKNNMIETNITPSLFGVNYRIMFSPIINNYTNEQIFVALKNIYHIMFSPKHFKENVVL